MVLVNRVDSFLQHYAEQPYNATKAHEYYLKNRELKGRTTSGMSELQKEAWTYSKDRVSSDKKQKVEANKIANEQKIEAFQRSAEATRARISDKLKLLSKQLTSKAESDREDVAAKLEADIANVAPIPKNISSDQRAILVERRNKEIDDIRNTASKHGARLSSDTKESRQEGSDSASGEREKTRTDLKAVIAKTRDAYTKAKVQLDASYEAIYQKEYDKVKTTIAGKPKPKAKAKGESKGTGTGKGKGAAKSKDKSKDKSPAKAKEPGKKGIIYYSKAEMAANKRKG